MKWEQRRARTHLSRVLHACEPILYPAICREAPEGEGEWYKKAIVITEPEVGQNHEVLTGMRERGRVRAQLAIERRGATGQILRFEDENHNIIRNKRLISEYKTRGKEAHVCT